MWKSVCITLMLLAACAPSHPHFAGSYSIVGYAEPGTHVASETMPRWARGMTLILREDGSATMRLAGRGASDGEYVVDADNHRARITSGGAESFLASFNDDTLVMRVPGGGPSFYLKRTQ